MIGQAFILALRVAAASVRQHTPTSYSQSRLQAKIIISAAFFLAAPTVTIGNSATWWRVGRRFFLERYSRHVYLGKRPPHLLSGGFPCFTSLQWLGTDRARLGYAQDRFLIYATGGVAYGSVNATILNAGIFNIDNETHARVGYTVGGGIEAIVYAIGR